MARKIAMAAQRASGRSDQRRKGLPSSDQIAQRAYEIFLARGATHGQDLDDWLRAEEELRPHEAKSH